MENAFWANCEDCSIGRFFLFQSKFIVLYFGTIIIDHFYRHQHINFAWNRRFTGWELAI